MATDSRGKVEYICSFFQVTPLHTSSQMKSEEAFWVLSFDSLHKASLQITSLPKQAAQEKSK